MENTYDATNFPDLIDAYDVTVRDYYKTRTGGTKDSSWSQEMKQLVGTESRPHMRVFLNQRGFLLK